MPQPGGNMSDATSALPSLTRQRLADQIADVLREQMLTGSLQPGTPVNERDTSVALGVSRTPLREALLILEAEGLINMMPARSPVVASPSLQELTELLVVQGALESLAGELACKNASEAQLADIRGMYQTMIDTNDSTDTVAYFRTDMAFHQAIVQAGGNQTLVKTHKHYNTRLWRARYMSSRSRLGRINTMLDHKEIVEGLEKRDANGVAAVLQRHLDQAIINVTTIFEANNNNDTDHN